LEKHSSAASELCAEQDRLDALRDERRAAAILDRSSALIEVASAIFKRYGKEKAARGILDFDDLIDKTLALLGRSTARWVLYKLDSGIDHILVDEAQDTSEAQWKISRRAHWRFRRRAGAKPRSAHFLRGRRRKAIDLFFSRRSAAHVRRDAGEIR
jgi:ATP-dependent helicase/nuclease subunit A